MCRFKQVQDDWYSELQSLNTSHVSVQESEIKKYLNFIRGLNTSHVSVQATRKDS